MNSKTRTPLDAAALFLATGFGAGRLPAAPGTWGSLVGLLLAWGGSWLPWEYRLVAAGAGLLAGVPLCGRAAQLLGRADPPSVVWDEIVGVLWTMLFVPFGPGTAVLGFLLFRLFDVTKPWPIHRFEKLHGGLGIMADDLAAALGAGGSLWICWQLLFDAGAG